MSPQGSAAPKLGAIRRPARSTGRHRAATRRAPAPRKLFGITAAIAAAGAVTVTPGASTATTTPGTTVLDQARLDSISVARIDRQRLATRDAARIGLNPLNAKDADAAKQARARAVRISQLQAQSRRRAAALTQAKKLAAAKRAAEAKKLAAARAAQAAEAKAKLEAADEVEMMVSGYHITATFNQAGGRWAHNHTGLDFAAPIGNRIGAVEAGEVISAEFAGAYGRRVEVRHDDGTVTWYCHMSEFTVSVGDRVGAGDQVGSVGMTGNTTGPHLHFEVHPGGGDAIDPYPWLREHGLNP